MQKVISQRKLERDAKEHVLKLAGKKGKNKPAAKKDKSVVAKVVEKIVGK